MGSTQMRGLSGTALKWTALLLMVLDHIHYFFGFTGYIPDWFSMAGRLSAPLFLFCLVEGFSHTHSRRHYFIKIYAISTLMSLVLYLILRGYIPTRPDGFFPLNGIMSAFVILMVIWQGFDWLGEGRWGRGLAAVVFPLAWPVAANLLMQAIPALQGVLGLLCYSVLPIWNGNADSAITLIVTGVLLYLFRKRRRVQAAVFVGWMLLYFLVYVGFLVSAQPGFHWTQMFTDYYEWYGALAAGWMLCYNGQRGQGRQGFFYLFYPAHIYLFYALSFLLC